MVAGIRWRRALPKRATRAWTFLHSPDGLADAVVVIDGTDDDAKFVAANDAARNYLDRVDDGQALTQITARYTDARQAPVSLTLARQQWRLNELEDQVRAALDSVLADEGDVDLTTLSAQTQELRERLDAMHASLAL